MTAEWETLPLLPLRCVLENLNTQDAFAAMSTCRHWRSAMLLYEGHKDSLKLRVKEIERNLFVTRVFRKHTKKLHIYVNSNREDLDNFMNKILPQYLDTQKLHELVFIGPTYLLQNQLAPIVKLNRVLTESLLFKHANSLYKFMLLGCELSLVKHDNIGCSNKLVEYYSKPLKFDLIQSRADTILSQSNIRLMNFSSLHYMALDYEQLNSANIHTFTQLRLSQVTLTIGLRRAHHLQRLPWPRSLRVAIVLVNVPQRKLGEVMENVLVEGLFLVSLKVMFCKTLYVPLMNHIVRLFKSTLQELVWVDSPQESLECQRIVRTGEETEADTCQINPFILLCWQCVHLRRLVLHGYWIWQYELMGLVRLRKGLEMLEVSAVYEHEKFGEGGALMRVLADDSPPVLRNSSIKQINEDTGFAWRPCSWMDLHPGLRAGSTPSQRACYVLRELGAR